MSNTFSHRVYYALKPLLPKRLRYVLRGIDARRKRKRAGDSWPMLPGSEVPPVNWPGWPEGKQFAVVLTHDVEGQKGLDRCQELMELESRNGFRSAFNFVPEGEYRVSSVLRCELTRRGFEVGVHDLHHDGSLYRSRESFLTQSAKINRYLKEWGAAGFRAGFMFHNLDWLHELNISYDASTYDVDPFEPQPDDMGTIFPFWVEKPGGGGGYLELPYTLVQDSSLLLLLREKTIDLWKKKVDWLAQHGGMVLLNTHPDYIGFDRQISSWDEFPAAFYAELLEYIRTKYSGRYWQALPREVAEYCTPYKPQRQRRSRRVCMVTHSFYEGDTRVARYAEALVERGDRVEVFALRAKPEMPVEETICGVKLRRVQDRFGKRSQSKLSYLFPVLRFLLVSSWRVWCEHRRRPYDFVHVHNVPDFLVFAAWYPRLKGARVLLDIHDILPEFFGNKFRAAPDGLLMRGLKWIERLSARFAHHVILGNHLWLDRYITRSASADKCSVFINNVDSDVFNSALRQPAASKSPGSKQIIIFPGGLQWHQGLDIAIRAFAKLRACRPSVEFHIYGNGNMREELEQLAVDLGVRDAMRFTDEIPLRKVATLMANADLGVVPKRADSFGNEAYSTKIMEFMAVGVPVVVSATKIDRYYFDDTVVRFFESGNVEALALAMEEVLSNEQLRQSLIANASAYAAVNSWKHRKHDYLALVDTLIERRPISPKDVTQPVVSESTCNPVQGC